MVHFLSRINFNFFGCDLLLILVVFKLILTYDLLLIYVDIAIEIDKSIIKITYNFTSNPVLTLRVMVYANFKLFCLY